MTLTRILCLLGFHDLVCTRERTAPDAPLVVQRVYCRRCLFHLDWLERA